MIKYNYKVVVNPGVRHAFFIVMTKFIYGFQLVMRNRNVNAVHDRSMW